MTSKKSYIVCGIVFLISRSWCERKAGCKIDNASKLVKMSQCSGTSPEPLDAGGLEGDVGVHAAGDGPG